MINRKINIPRHQITVVLITLVMFIFVGFDVAHLFGYVGVTKRGPDPYGCICHGANVPTDSILIFVTGPETVVVGSSNFYTVTMLGGPAVKGGFNVAVGAGEVYPVDTTAQRMENNFLKNELTHTQPKDFSSGSVSWDFMYEAPLTAGLDTIYSAGNSVNGDFSPAGDEYNFGIDFNLTIIDTNAYEFQMKKGWNLVSVPLSVTSPTKSILFPTSISTAFRFDANGGYLTFDTLMEGSGYWLKFSNDETISISGNEIDSIAVAVSEGWNIIGSISTVIPITGISSEPPGIVTSDFFAYQTGYSTVDSLKPSQGYWVKVNETGALMLDNTVATGAARIQIVHTDELPPSPPGMNEHQETLPENFSLKQNFPNPFNPVTKVTYELPTEAFVTIKVYSITGMEIATLVNEKQSAGEQSVAWDANDVPNGIYFCRMQGGGRTESMKMILLK